MGLGELLNVLEAALESADVQDRWALEADLVWCRIERGELGDAFALLGGDSGDIDSPASRELTRAEIQAYCGNEDAALQLLGRGLAESASWGLVRARVAAARGDWESARVLDIDAFDAAGARQRAALLAARACVEQKRFEDASALLALLEPRTEADALEADLLQAHVRNDELPAVLANVAARARSAGAARIEADAWADLALWHRSETQPEEMRKAAVRAVELWDDMLTSLPLSLRAGFWRDAKRDAVRSASKRSKQDTSSRGTNALERLLSNLRRLATERDPARLLSVITDGAVELTGAERGFVLLVDEHGTLEAATVQDAESRLGTEVAAFSRSIAETVLIDRDPVVTVDAARDARVQDFMSVHSLMLKSVACVPIESRGRTWGVLYLEHRGASGRFEGIDFSLLAAYADQAAIAIETSRLFAKIETQKGELEEANRALREANAQLEQRLRERGSSSDPTRRRQGSLPEASAQGERWGLVGASEGMRRVYEILERVSESDVPVVIIGESGTGKELIARAIHRGSRRSDASYVSMSCGAVPEGLLESELFGHVAGAFTGAAKARDGVFVQAHGGTLFMDEIADMPARMQLDLLRVLQEHRVRPVGASEERPVDVRLLTASKRPLRELIEEGRLREDLYYRLAVVEIRVPPLRERRSDIPLLSDHFLRRIAEERGEPKKRLSPDAYRRLHAHDFPGNVRELEHLLINATVFAAGDVIEADELAVDLGPRSATRVADASTYRDYKEGERERIIAALNANDWNRARAARALGMARRTFYRRLKEHGIELPSGSG